MMAKYKNPETGEIYDDETGETYIPEPADSGTNMRGLGLGTRAAIEGMAGLPMMIGNAANTALNYIPGVNLPMPSDVLSQGLTAAGLPSPQTSQEQLLSAIQAGGVGAASGLSVGGLAARMTPAAAPLLTAPRTQLVGGMTGGGGSEFARQEGAGPGGQVMAGLLAGAAPGVVNTLAQTAVSTITDLGRPFVRVGRQTIAGRSLLDMADEPGAITIDENATIGPATLGQATSDLGLMQGEKIISRLGDQNKVKFGLLRQQQHAAREEAFNNVAGFGDDLAVARDLREEITKPMREAAFKQQSRPINDSKIIAAIENILASPDGEREVVQKALQPLIERVKGRTTVERMYGICKDINDKIAGKSETPTDKFAKSQLMKVREAIDSEIESVAPGWREYLISYAKQSLDIDRLKILQDVRERITNPLPTTDGSAIYSVSKLATQLRTKLKGFDLRPGQREAVERIKADLAKTAEPPELRASGSDTFGNFSSANVLGNFISNTQWRNNPAVQTMLRPLNFIYKMPDEAITDMIGNAMVDPKYAELLMRRASDQNIKALGQILREYAPASALGGSYGLLGQKHGD